MNQRARLAGGSYEELKNCREDLSNTYAKTVVPSLRMKEICLCMPFMLKGTAMMIVAKISHRLMYKIMKYIGE